MFYPTYKDMQAYLIIMLFKIKYILSRFTPFKQPWNSSFLAFLWLLYKNKAPRKTSVKHDRLTRADSIKSSREKPVAGLVRQVVTTAN